MLAADAPMFSLIIVSLVLRHMKEPSINWQFPFAAVAATHFVFFDATAVASGSGVAAVVSWLLFVLRMAQLMLRLVSYAKGKVRKLRRQT